VFEGALDDRGGADPVDFLEVHADNELIDALVAGYAWEWAEDHASQRERRLVAALRDWRDEVHQSPLPTLATVQEAGEAIAAGRSPARSRRRGVSALAAAAVLLAVAGAAVSVSNTTQPAPPLPQTALATPPPSLTAASQVSLALDSARRALAEGRVADARSELAAAAPVLGQIQDARQRDQLAAQSGDLLRVAQRTPPEGHRVDTDRGGPPHEPARSPGPASVDRASRPERRPVAEPPAMERPPSSTEPARPKPTATPPARDPRQLMDARRAAPPESSTPDSSASTRERPAPDPIRDPSPDRSESGTQEDHGGR
jgi:hypothetical protein